MTRLLALVFQDGEPIAHGQRLQRIAEAVLEGLGTNKPRMWAVSVGGRSGKAVALTWPAFSELMAEQKTGLIYVEATSAADSDLAVELYLRHNPKVPTEFGPPGMFAVHATV